jgi:hypothetical protein
LYKKIDPRVDRSGDFEFLVAAIVRVDVDFSTIGLFYGKERVVERECALNGLNVRACPVESANSIQSIDYPFREIEMDGL